MPMNPFDWSGPNFLQFYAVLVTGALLGAWAARRMARGAAPPPTTSSRGARLDPYETSFLAGGGRRTALLAVASLADRGQIELDPEGKFVLLKGSPTAAAPAVERAILGRAEKSLPIRDVGKLISPAMETIRHSLVSEGLLVPEGSLRFARLVTRTLVTLTLAAGVLKVVIGATRDRPVGYLIGMMIAYVVVVIVTIAMRPLFRTRAGDALVKRLRDQVARDKGKATPWKSNVKPSGTSADAAALNDRVGAESTAVAVGVPMMLVALWGTDALPGHAYASQLKRQFALANTSGSGCSSGSSCGSGGGGGGGGCGGCGGGGGD